MNIKLIRVGVTLALTFITLPFVASAAAVITLGPGGTTSDSGVESIESVEIHFNEVGKLFALVSVKFSATVRVDPTGRVALEYPWYSRLTVDRREALTSELAVAVDNALHGLMVGKVVGAGEVEPKSYFSAEEASVVQVAVNSVLKQNFGIKK